MDYLNNILQGDCLKSLKRLPDNSIDSIVTDPPYQLDSIKKRWVDPGNTKLDFKKHPLHRVARGFMGRTWDVLPQTEVWKECLRVLKPGAFAFIMCTPRQDSLLESMSRIKEAGFIMGFTPIFWAYACVSEDTEILTNNGFKKWNEIEIEDRVATMNVEEEKLEYQPILNKYVYDYNGKMINIKNTNTDQLLTPNHRVLCRRRTNTRYEYGEWEYDTSSNIAYGRKSSCYIKLPLACKHEGKISIGKDMAELLGWVISDGSLYNGARNAKDVRIFQSENVNGGEHVNRIRSLLERIGIPFGEYTKKEKYSDIIIKGRRIKKKGVSHGKIFVFSGEWCNRVRELIPEKKLTKELLNLIPEELESLFIGLILGDGSRNPSGTSCAFYQKDIQTRDFVQILSLHLGYRSSTNESKWMINICYRNSTEIQNPNKIKAIKYSGKVWCVQTKNSNFVARRNGKIFITGNSGLPKAHDIAKAIDRRAGQAPRRNPYRGDAQEHRGRADIQESSL